MRVLVGVTGSIAAYKAIELVRSLTQAGHTVQVALTESAQRFVTPLTFEALTQRAVLTDLWSLQGHEIEHVERAHDVDVVVVAPASANTLARLAHGLADDVLSAIVLSTRAPLVLAPAMESGMWLNAATQHNVATLRARGASVVEPESGVLASGRSGVGRLAALERVLAAIEAAGSPDQTLAGRRVVITAGPTYERIDPVRVLTNRSTGEMGIALAAVAARRGAAVRLVLGPTHLSPPAGLSRWCGWSRRARCSRPRGWG
jgi:phosphopantothenoylcysteine decarboxylase/phosphopantothenate--cysteine ligase